MERKAAGIVVAIALFGAGWALGGLSAAGPAAGGRGRDWFDVLDIALRVATAGIFACGLLGTFALLTSLKATTYSQMYARFQTLLLKLAEHPEWFDAMKRGEYTALEDDPADATGPTQGHRFIANAMLNLYEEAYQLRQSRVVALYDTMSADYWESLLWSMREAFRLRYVRTQWERRMHCFPPDFNRFVRAEVLPEAVAELRPKGRLR